MKLNTTIVALILALFTSCNFNESEKKTLTDSIVNTNQNLVNQEILQIDSASNNYILKKYNLNSDLQITLSIFKNNLKVNIDDNKSEPFEFQGEIKSNKFKIISYVDSNNIIEGELLKNYNLNLVKLQFKDQKITNLNLEPNLDKVEIEKIKYSHFMKLDSAISCSRDSASFIIDSYKFKINISEDSIINAVQSIILTSLLLNQVSNDSALTKMTFNLLSLKNERCLPEFYNIGKMTEVNESVVRVSNKLYLKKLRKLFNDIIQHKIKIPLNEDNIYDDTYNYVKINYQDDCLFSFEIAKNTYVMNCLGRNIEIRSYSNLNLIFKNNMFYLIDFKDIFLGQKFKEFETDIKNQIKSKYNLNDEELEGFELDKNYGLLRNFIVVTWKKPTEPDWACEDYFYINYADLSKYWGNNTFKQFVYNQKN